MMDGQGRRTRRIRMMIMCKWMDYLSPESRHSELVLTLCSVLFTFSSHSGPGHEVHTFNLEWIPGPCPWAPRALCLFGGSVIHYSSRPNRPMLFFFYRNQMWIEQSADLAFGIWGNVDLNIVPGIQSKLRGKLYSNGQDVKANNSEKWYPLS